MFRLHETTQRRVCRWAFVLLCAAPTFAVVVWIVYGHRPWRLSDEQRRLSAALYADVRLTSWRVPRPGVERTATVELGEPGEAERFAKLSKLEIRRTGDVAWLTADQVSFDVQRLHMLAARLPLWLDDLAERELRFRCRRLTLNDPESNASATYRDVEAVIRGGDGGGHQVQLIAQADSDAAEAPRLRASLRISLTDDAGSSAISAATVDATEAPLPLWLMSALAPIGRGWGEDAAFAGTIRIDAAGDQRRGTAAGSLAPLDLSTIAAAAGAHRAEGHAIVDLDELRWHGARIDRVAGVVQAQSIRMSRSVIAAAAEQLFCRHVASGSPLGPSAGELIAVDAVSCRFSLDADGLALAGTLPEAAGIPAGSMVAAAGQPLLATPPYARLHPSAWVQFIAGRTTGWVPATREAIEAASRLPLPAAIHEPDAEH
jgi:hypothetical protein